MRAAARRAGVALRVDSAGTGDWHVGKPPDPRAIAMGRRHGIAIDGLRARQVTQADFRTFDRLVALDGRNLADLRALRPADATAQLALLLDHVEGRAGQDVADPYFGDECGFEACWGDIVAGIDSLLRSLQPSG